MRIRPATERDLDTIVGFTTDTFEWGDYVPALIGEWIADETGIVMVVADEADMPVAMARAVFLTDVEVWSHAARVHPDFRGQGLAGDLADALLDWARARGGQIVRLLIEDDNLASIRHITKKHFRHSVSAIRATRGVGAASPNPHGNGGQRQPSKLATRPGRSRDLSLVRSSWNSSEVGRVMRGLIGSGWRFHRLRDTDIDAAARGGMLWEVGSSWAITGSIEPVFEVGMLDTTQDDAYDVMRALIDTANNRGAESMTLWLADTVWMVQAARRAGFEVSGHGIWEKPI